MNCRLPVALLSFAMSFASSTAFARSLSLRVIASPEAIAVTGGILYVFHWADGTMTNGSMSASDIQAGGRVLTINDADQVIGCESSFWFSNNISPNTIIPRDTTPLLGKSVPCVKVDDSKFNLVPQFSARTLTLKVLPQAFDENQASRLFLSFHSQAEGTYTTPSIPQLQKNLTPYSAAFTVISDGPIELSVDAVWIKTNGTVGNSEVSEDSGGTISFQ